MENTIRTKALVQFARQFKLYIIILTQRLILYNEKENIILFPVCRIIALSEIKS